MAKKAKDTTVTKDDPIEVAGPDGETVTMMEKQRDFTTSVQLWVGGPKVGKTSTAAALGTVARKYGLKGVDPFILTFESGTGGVQCRCPTKDGKRLVLRSREDIEKWFDWAASSPFNPIVIDTGDAMFQAVVDYTCAGLGITSPFGADDHGVSWAMIYDEMRSKLATITASKSLIIIMHTQIQQVRTRGGAVIEKAVFNVSGKTRTYLAGMADQYLHFTVMPDDDGNDQHVIIAAPQSGIEAGDRWGLFPEKLVLGGSAEDAAAAILATFGYLEKE